VVAVSSFTTQSVSYLREKITQQLLQAPPPVAADFNIGPNGSRAIFAFDQIESIRHNQQVSPAGPPQPGEAYNLTGSRWGQGGVWTVSCRKFSGPRLHGSPGRFYPADSNTYWFAKTARFKYSVLHAHTSFRSETGWGLASCCLRSWRERHKRDNAA